MSGKKRKKYRNKSKKKTSLIGNPIFRKFLYFASIIVLAFAVWQIFFYTPQGDRVINVKEDTEQEELAQSSVKNAIKYALKRLEVPNKFIHSTKEDNQTFFNVVVDKNRLSLTICNIFITDTIKEAGGQILKADESSKGNSLQIKIFDPENKHYYFLKIEIDQEEKYDKITRLSVIVDDCGFVNGSLLEDFMSLDEAITFSIIPELKYSQTIMQKAYNQGRETMIHIPMEPESYPQNDPGDNAIFVDYSEKKIKTIVKEFVQELPMCVGANNHMGSLATRYKNIMKPVFEVLKENGMFFVDSKTTPQTATREAASDVDISVAENSIFLDNGNAQSKVKTATQRILSYAKNHENIIAITHFKRSSLSDLKKILQNIEGENIKLVPISEIVEPEEYVL